MIHATLPLLAGLSIGVILAAVFFLFYQIVKQQGRFLLRLDGVEAQLAGLLTPSGSAPASGLPVGELFPPFRLPGLDGKEVALEDLRGKRVLLINWSPDCGFCVRIAPELAGLRGAFRARNVELLLAGNGDAESNRRLAREHGLEESVLLSDGESAIQPFQNFGTPVAYLLDERGKVAVTLAFGLDRVSVLARYAGGGATEAELSATVPGKKGVCGQHANEQPATAGELVSNGAGTGTELKNILARIGIAVTPDCPCSERAALMDRNGLAWCEQNFETIVGWMREESARRHIIFVDIGARFLLNRAIANTRRRASRIENRTVINKAQESAS